MASDPFDGVAPVVGGGDPFDGVAPVAAAPFDFAPLADTFRKNLDTHGAGQPVTGLVDALDAGFQSSVSGLILRGKTPDKVLAEDADMKARIGASVGALAGDLPAMVGGFAIGTPAGGGVASAATGAAAAFALPAALRSTLMDAYEKGSFTNFGDFWDRASGILLDTAKGWITGAATGAAGPLTAGALPAAASPAIKAATSTAAEVATMTTVGKAVEGQVPSASDFVEAAIVIGGMKGASKAAAKLRGIYAKTGVPPQAVVADAARDPTVAADVLSTNRPVPDAYAKGMAEPTVDAVVASIHKQESGGAETAKTSVTGARGGMQIQPETFAQYAKPGEKIDNPADNLAVGRRIIEDLYKQAGGDPARVAVGYFSGPGNIAPAGAATPWKRDIADPTGKTTSSYVRDVVRRLGGIEPTGGGAGSPPKPPPSAAEPKPTDPGDFQSAQQSILDKINIGGKDETRKTTWGRIYTDTIDRLFPIARATSEAAGGERLATAEDPYRLARLYAGVGGKADHMLNRGTFDFATYRNTGPSLKQTLDPIKGKLDDFRAYIAASRAVELEGRGIKSGFDPEAAKTVVKAGKGQFGELASQIIGYQDRVAKYLRDSGMLSKEGYAAMREANRNYVPFYRIMEDKPPGGGKTGGPSLTPNNPVKGIKGSERDIVDPLESIIRNTFSYTQMAERNAVATKLVDTLLKAQETAGREVGLIPNAGKAPGKDVAIIQRLPDVAPSDPTVTKLVGEMKLAGVEGAENLAAIVRTAIDSGGDRRGEITVFRAGKRETFKVDPELARSIKALDVESANLLERILAAPARTLRAGAVLSPDFMVRNPVRDLFSAVINSKGVFTPLDTISGLLSAIRKDDHFWNWVKAGGANNVMTGIDRRYLQESLEKLTHEAGLMSRAWNIVNPLNALRVVSELSEQATRLGEFKKVSGGATDKAALQDAAFASREVSLDFARMGAKMRAVNMVSAFFNASLQGIDRTVREAKDRPANFAFKVAAGVTIPSVLLWAANHDDERYKEIPQWQKDLFWIVMTDEHIYRIPKPFEVGILFGSMPERMLDAWVADSPDAFKGAAQSILSAFLPSAIPTFAAPIVEQFANRSTFTDRALIPRSMEGQLPEYQYTDYTTETAKLLGSIFGQFPGMENAAINPSNPLSGVARAMTSPVLLENYLRAWTGGLGMYALQAADSGLRAAGVVPDPPEPAATLADIPVVKAFAVRYPSASAQSIQDFYDRYDENKTYYDTWMAQARGGNLQALDRIQAGGGPLMFVQLDGIAGALGDISKITREVAKNPDIPPEEKRQLIDSMYFRMIDLSAAGVGIMRKFE